jgi:large subunit ribosomal protein L25
VQEGGVLDLIHREVHVRCLPTEIPERIDVDITKLNIGDSLHIKDLALPAGVECVEDPEDVLAVILAPRLEEEPAAEVVGADAKAEPEVIKKGKEEKAEEKEEK